MSVVEPEPKWRQIAHLLRSVIVAGEYGPGAALPGEAVLAERYGVKRPAIRQALALLQAEGLIYAEHGRGTFVRERRQLLHHGTARYDRTGRAPGQSAFEAEVGRVEPTAPTRRELTAVEEVPAPLEAATRLGLAEDEPVVVRRHVFWLGEDPVQLLLAYYPVNLARGTTLAEVKSTPSGVHAYLEDELGYRLTRAAEDVEARMPTPDETQLLRLLPGVPVLGVWRTRYAGERPLEAALQLFPGDRWRLGYETPIGRRG
ncbi:MAG TPA: GntR family transcriptional regulator [Candidatus Dormibacteraeota bacterium]|nr:GntR family transcriptional regulator [Candidatus Dormibacteraeota bacterium]